MIPLNRDAVRFIILHHTQSPRDATTPKHIEAWHIERGMDGIGFHWIITADGMMNKGRALDTPGDHCASNGMNWRSIGICLTGDFTWEQPSQPQLDTLRDRLARICAEYEIPRANVLGHREVACAETECPGDNLMAWLQQWRAEMERPASG